MFFEKMGKKIISIFERNSFKDLKKMIDNRLGFGLLERTLFVNWFNPFATLWLNLRSFPIKQAMKFPIWCYGRPRFYDLSGDMLIEGKIFSGMIRFNQVKSGAPSNMSVQSEMLNQGLIIFRGQGMIGTGNKIRVAPTAVLDIGRNFKITDMCNIGCFQEIFIGEQSRITHRCQIFDSNYHFVANFASGVVPKVKRAIHIGKGCWICNSSTITSGAVLPDFTIVASHSLVGKDFSEVPENSMIGGVPAKFIATGFRKIENSKVELDIYKYYHENPEGLFSIPESATMDEYSFVDRYR